jgi:hypothetical protein
LGVVAAVLVSVAYVHSHPGTVRALAFPALVAEQAIGVSEAATGVVVVVVHPFRP